MRWIIAAALVLGGAHVALADQGSKAIVAEHDRTFEQARRDFCADRWLTDFVMQEECLKEELVAERAMNKLTDGSLLAGLPKSARASFIATIEIALNCQGRWKTSRGWVDWTMALECTKEQVEAYDRLH